ncbi:hypothetical protein BG003_010311 [Podila horticola]|nr:hypothetical protein BG003_010311 [Podila horticola]
MIADDASFEQSEWGNTELDSPNSVFSGELAYLAGMRVCSKSLAEVTMALFESSCFTRIWTLQESVLPSTIVLTHETTSFNGRVDLLSALDLVQELRNYFCRYGYALSNEFEEDNPGFNNITSAAQMSGSGASQQYIDSDDSMDDTESVASDSVRGENRKVFYVGPILKSDAIPEDRDEDAYFFNRDFKVLYNSIANIIKLRSNPDLLGVIKVITGLNRRCEKPPDYFYGIAGLVGLKLKSGQDVRKLFYIFVNKLVALNDNVAWEKPDWSNKALQEYELYKYIVVTNLKVIKEGMTAPTSIIRIKKLLKAFTGTVDSFHKTLQEALGFDNKILANIVRSLPSCETGVDTAVMVEMNRVEIDMPIAYLGTVISKLMRQCMDRRCEMMSSLTSKLRDNSYIYLFCGTVILSSVAIGGKFELVDVGISKEETECRLGMNGRVVGVVFTACGCQQRSVENEQLQRREEFLRGFAEFQSEVDGDVTERDYKNFMRYGWNYRAYR